MGMGEGMEGGMAWDGMVCMMMMDEAGMFRESKVSDTLFFLRGEERDLRRPSNRDLGRLWTPYPGLSIHLSTYQGNVRSLPAAWHGMYFILTPLTRSFLFFVTCGFQCEDVNISTKY